MEKKHRSILFIAALTAGMLAAGNPFLVVRRYRVLSKKITSRIRIGLVTDLHSCYYGKKQKNLLCALERENPDILLLGGDIIDDIHSPKNALQFLSSAAKRYPTFYVSGNHECRKGLTLTREMVLRSGVSVLAGTCNFMQIGGEKISLCGVDDPFIGEEQFCQQLANCAAQKDGFSILLSHRPERIFQYLQYGFDLVLAGHAHGGQWRIPKVLNGLYAPNQGFFPSYAGGKYDFKNTTLIVSRGLARETTVVPRIFNRPELVIIDIV